MKGKGAAGKMRRIKIVIVDRNDITRKGMQAIVSDANTAYEVVGAFPHLRESYQFLQQQIVDLFIIDDYTIHTI